MKTVLILGAGASADCGAPLMRDFISTAKRLQERDVFGASTAAVQDVLDAAYRDLRSVHAKSSFDYLNIEELFSIIDMGAMLGVFGPRNSQTLEALRHSVRIFIYRTLEETVRIQRSDKRIELPPGYGPLAQLPFETMKEAVRHGRDDVSFITFNYDTCLEYALVRSNVGVDYALGEAFLEPNEQRYAIVVPVLKLHGSINWAKCPKCNAIVPTEIDPWSRANFIDLMDSPKGLKLELGTRIARWQHHCGSALNPVPVIVPPTWNKVGEAADLAPVWRRAARELSTAENIVVIGYSLPPTDTFFKYLFAPGSDSDVHLERFILMNRELGAGSVARFDQLLGPMSRRAFTHHEFVFGHASAQNIIRDVLTPSS